MQAPALIAVLLAATGGSPSAANCAKAAEEYRQTFEEASRCTEADQCQLYSADVYYVQGTKCPLFISDTAAKSKLQGIEVTLHQCGIPMLNCGSLRADCVRGNCVGKQQPASQKVRKKNKASKTAPSRKARKQES